MNRSSVKLITGAAIAVISIAPAAIAEACGEDEFEPDPTPATHPSGFDPHPAVTGNTMDPSAFGGFYGYPQLGHEPVRGSGCGGDGSIGDSIPDGVWAGYIEQIWDGSPDFAVDVDLACVYYGESARQVLAQAGPHIDNIDPNFLVVNNNSRTRSVNGGAQTSARSGRWTDQGCAFDTGWPPDRLGQRLAWIEIVDGELAAIHFSCG